MKYILYRLFIKDLAGPPQQNPGFDYDLKTSSRKNGLRVT